MHSWQGQSEAQEGVALAEPSADAQLLARFVQGRDEQAFEELVQRHGPMVMGVCRGVLVHSHDAEDAFQATFLVLAQKSARIRHPELLGNWLYGVAYRIAKRAKRSKPRSLPMSAVESETVPPAPDVALKELQVLIDEELRRLPDRHRLLLTLCYFQGLTHAQVARQLGWRSGSVSRRLTKARELLRARLRRRGLTCSIGALILLLGQMGGPASVSAELIKSTASASAALAAGNPLDTVVPLRVAALARTIGAARRSAGVLLLALILFLGPCGLNIDAGGPRAVSAPRHASGRETSATKQHVELRTLPGGLSAAVQEPVDGPPTAEGVLCGAAKLLSTPSPQ